MSLNRRQFTAASAAALLGAPGLAQVPERPIRIVIGFSAGGGVDIVTRTIAAEMTKVIGQPVVVENRAGGEGVIAADHVAKSAPDGNTIYVGSGNSMIGTPILRAGAVPYDPFKDFTPISQMGRFTLVLVAAPGLGVNTLEAFARHVKTQPGKLNYASSNTTTRLAAMQVLDQLGLKMEHVGYKGDSPAVTDLMADRVHLMFTTVAAGRGFVKEGRMKALMVMREARTSEMPDVPTHHDLKIKMRITPWSGWFGPAKMQPAVVDRLNQALRAAVSGNEVRERFEKMGFEPVMTTPAEMAALHREEYEVFRKAVQEEGVKFG